MNKLEEIATALRMRANYIETGDISLSRNDAIAQKKHKIIKALSTHQEDLVRNLRKWADQIQWRKND